MTRHNRAELPVEILRHVLEGQRLQPEFGRIRGPADRIAPAAVARTPPQAQPVGRWQGQNLGRIAPLSETCQDIHRRCVGPLEILDPHDERGLLGKRLERGATSRSMRAAVDTCVPRQTRPRPPPRARADAAASLAHAWRGWSRRCRRRPTVPAGSADQQGMGGSDGPEARMHCAHVALIACRVGATRRNASQSDVLPIPASPVTKTTWRCEAAASSKAANNRFISGCRPTNIGSDELAAASAGASRRAR